MTNRSASSSRASSSLARSLSITASTPTRQRRPSTSSYLVGTPPPPAQITTVPCSSSHRIGRISKIRFGSGDGTTRRQLAPSCLNAQPFSRGQRIGLRLVVHGADELRRVGEGRVAAVDLDHREHGRERLLEREQVAEFLLDQVADHALGLRPEHVERIRLDVGVRGRLQREQPDLRPVAVRDHQLVLLCDGRESASRDAHVLALRLGRHRLAAPQKCVATQSHDDPHRVRPLTRPWWRRGRP